MNRPLGTFSFTDGKGDTVEVRVEMDEQRLCEFARQVANRIRGKQQRATRANGALHVVIVKDSARGAE